VIRKNGGESNLVFEGVTYVNAFLNVIMKEHNE
jgi:hypothetical protein